MSNELLKISDSKVLEGGIYSLNEAALYAKVPTRTLKGWYLGSERTRKVLDTHALIEEGKYLNFLDFIQALGIRELRVHHKIPLPKIREAIIQAQDKYGIEYPFAKDHKTFFDGKGILIEIDGELVHLTSPHIDQFSMKPIVEYYIRELKFNDEGYASQFRPQKGILLDPSLRFGEPILEKYGVTAFTIYESVLAEGEFETVADLYEIEVEDVVKAYKYIDNLKAA